MDTKQARIDYNHPFRPRLGSTESLRAGLGTSGTILLRKGQSVNLSAVAALSYGQTRDLEIRRGTLGR